MHNFCPPRTHLGDIATYVGIQPVKDSGGDIQALRLDETRETIIKEYERLQREPVAETELTRARNYIVGTFAMAHERNRQKAWQLGRFECLGVGYEYDRKFPELVKKVAAADVQRVAREYFNEGVVAAVIPQAMP
jgi:predicted Zn-dependent peptidase